jgi:hypothetical protein
LWVAIHYGWVGINAIIIAQLDGFATIFILTLNALNEMRAMSMTEEEIQQSIEKEEEKMRNVTASYDLKLKEIENMYEQMMNEQAEAIEKIKSGDLALYKSVQVSGKQNYEEILRSLLLMKQKENGQ